MNISGYAGKAAARFLDGSGLGQVFVMLHRDPLPDDEAGEKERTYLSDEDYGEWWGYLRYECEPNDPLGTPSHRLDPIIIEPGDSPAGEPRLGWPGASLVLDVISSFTTSRAYEALVRERWESDPEAP